MLFQENQQNLRDETNPQARKHLKENQDRITVTQLYNLMVFVD